jgi:hypothetical protein
MSGYVKTCIFYRGNLQYTNYTDLLVAFLKLILQINNIIYRRDVILKGCTMYGKGKSEGHPITGHEGPEVE